MFRAIIEPSETTGESRMKFYMKSTPPMIQANFNIQEHQMKEAKDSPYAKAGNITDAVLMCLSLNQKNFENTIIKLAQAQQQQQKN